VIGLIFLHRCRVFTFFEPWHLKCIQHMHMQSVGTSVESVDMESDHINLVEPTCIHIPLLA
jgi:hypothetical protein